MRKFFLLCALCACVLTAQADNYYYETIDGISYELYENGDTRTAVVQALDEEPYYYKGDIVIPATVDYDGVTYTVTMIDQYAFQYNDSVTSITLPNTIKTIGSEAFRDCYQLASINFPEGLEEIYGYAFWNCRSLTSITLPSTLTYLDWYAFEWCTSLRNITLPNNLQYVGGHVFLGDTLEAPVYNDKFFVFLPYNYTESYTIPDGIETICYAACYDNNRLKSVVIPSSVKTIEGEAFAYCDSLTSVTLNEGVQSIGDYAFLETAITSIALPASLTNLKASAFPSSLVTITVAEENPSYYMSGGCLLAKGTDALVFAPVGATLPEGVKEIGAYAFASRQDLIDFVVPSTVTKIGNYELNNCQNLKSINLPEGLTSIGSYVFNYCYELKSITLPSTLNDLSYASGMFAYCHKLESATILGNPTYIPDQFFYDCDSLKSFTLPESVKECSASAFCYSEGFTSPVLNSHLFASMPKGYKGEYTIPEGITEICDYAFYQCDGVTDVHFPSTLHKVGQEAFLGAYSLTRIELPEGVDSIMYYAFDACESVETLILPSTLSYIESYAFSFFSESKLKEIYNYATTPYEDPWWDLPFQDIPNLDQIKLYVPEGSVDAYKAAFWWQDFDVQPMPAIHTGLQNGEAELQGRKLLRNGQLLIEKNGKIYNALGQQVR